MLIAIPLRISPGLKHLHDLPPTHHSPTIQSSSHHLRQCGHVRDNAKILLGATDGIAKARDDFIKDEHDATTCCCLPEMLEKGRIGRDRVIVRAPGFSNDGRNIIRAVQRLRQGCRVIKGDKHDRALHFLGDTGRHRHVIRGDDSAHDVIVPAMEMALKLDDFTFASVGACGAQCQKGGFSARAGEFDRLRARHQVHDQTGPVDFESRTPAGVRTACHLLTYGLDDSRVRMPQQHGTVPHPVIDVAIAIHIPLVRAHTAVHVEWKGIEGPCHMRHATRQERLRLLVQSLGFWVFLGVFAGDGQGVLTLDGHEGVPLTPSPSGRGLG